MPTVRLARMAMATRFELVLEGEDEKWLRAAGEEALTEIERLEAQLSLFRSSSEISRINARAANEAVRVEPRLFALLQTAQRISRQSGGAFDPTVAPLMRAWGFVRNSGRLPDPAALEEARCRTGMHRVALDPSAFSVRFDRAGMRLDLGGIGKGYAVDEAITILKEAGVERALLHGGTSTIYGIGSSPWKVAIPYPGADENPGEEDVLALVSLQDVALSVSAVWGKAFEVDGKTYGHVLDPRLGRPVEGAVLAAVVLPSATEADALSTALLVLGHEGRNIFSNYELMKFLLLFPPGSDGRFQVSESGIEPLPSDRYVGRS